MVFPFLVLLLEHKSLSKSLWPDDDSAGPLASSSKPRACMCCSCCPSPRRFQVHSFPRAAVAKGHKLASLKQQNCVLSQFRRLKIRNQDVGRVGSFWRLCGRICSMLLFQLLVAAGDPRCPLTCRCIIPISAFFFT